jgi:hypothetical protein
MEAWPEPKKKTSVILTKIVVMLSADLLRSQSSAKVCITVCGKAELAKEAKTEGHESLLSPQGPR